MLTPLWQRTVCVCIQINFLLTEAEKAGYACAFKFHPSDRGCYVCGLSCPSEIRCEVCGFSLIVFDRGCYVCAFQLTLSNSRHNVLVFRLKPFWQNLNNVRYYVFVFRLTPFWQKTLCVCGQIYIFLTEDIMCLCSGWHLSDRRHYVFVFRLTPF